MKEFDFVVVGAGSAGCVVVKRLVDAGYTVGLIEAGPEDTNPYIKIPAGFMKTYYNKELTWQFDHQTSEFTNHRKIPFILGKTLGGSSSLNGTIYSRGQSIDFDTWAAMGAEGWGYSDVLSYFKKSESFKSDPPSASRGVDGPLNVTRIARRDFLTQQYIASAVNKEIPFNPDYNAEVQDGVSYTQGTIFNGKRSSTSRTYLQSVKGNSKLKIFTNSQVKKIIFNGKTAVAVQVVDLKTNQSFELKFQRELILSAGAVNTPKILQLSGVGDAAYLFQLGIESVEHLPAVGKNLADHYAARIVADLKPGLRSINYHAKGIPLVAEVAKWLLNKPSILAISTTSAYAFCKVDSASKFNDYSLSFTPASFKMGMTRQLDDISGVTSGAWVLRPKSRGEVRITASDFRENPYINPNYLADAYDRDTLIHALKSAKKIFQTDPIASLIDKIKFPLTECRDDDEWLSFIKEYGMTAYHLIGTCRMGDVRDPEVVVDAQLRLKNIERVRVMDASVMPTITSGNTNAATIMIAEKGVDMLLQHYLHKAAA